LQARRFLLGKEEEARVRRFEGAEQNKKKKLQEEESVQVCEKKHLISLQEKREVSIVEQKKNRFG
jgi:hypothetical protein